jgi:sulfite reductase beta subunit-like hemoprotein
MGVGSGCAVADSRATRGLQTNPMYGRGCAAFVQAEVLAEVLATLSDPEERADRYHARTRKP